MSYFQRPTDTLEEEQTAAHEQPRSPGFRLTDLRDRIAGAFASLDRGPVDYSGFEQGQQTDPYDAFAPGAEESAPFPVDPLGYNRDAVDQHIARLEAEIGELRESVPAMSISEEIERLGEQTSSILVVAHDQAHETTRLAQERADRCIADAASNAVALTERAKRKLQELDNETDAVWRERARLLEDARAVGASLIALADDAAERFPADPGERGPEDAGERGPENEEPAERFPGDVKPVRAQSTAD